MIAKENYPDISSDDFHNSDYLASEIAADIETSSIVYNVCTTFHEWVQSLPKPNRSKMLYIEKSDSLFFTFNYTLTLELLYKIPSNRVLHIHGGQNDNKFIIGHGKSYSDFIREASISKQEPPSNLDLDQLEAWYSANNDQFVEQALKITAQRLSEMEKPVGQIISENNGFFSKLTDVISIHIYGFSFSDIDMPYIHEILNYINIEKTSWEVSFFSPQDKTAALSFKQFAKIPDNNFRLICLNDLLFTNYLQQKLPFSNQEDINCFRGDL